MMFDQEKNLSTSVSVLLKELFNHLTVCKQMTDVKLNC